VGKQQKLKDGRKHIARRLEVLKRIDLPYPYDLAKMPAGEALVSIYAEAAGRISECMADAVTPHSLKQAVHAALLYLDELLHQVPTTVEFADIGWQTVACRAGCNHCCTIRVTTTGPIVLALASHLKKRLTPEQFASLLERLRAHSEQGLALAPIEQVLKGRMCPLNVDGLCVGYEYRPNTCRSYHSMSVAQCEADRADPFAENVVYQDPQRMGMNALVSRALTACTCGFGLNDDELELVPALLISLTEDSVAERYISGEPVFASAHSPEVIGAQLRDLSKRGVRLLPQVPSR
jgi:hypothetical protein